MLLTRRSILFAIIASFCYFVKAFTQDNSFTSTVTTDSCCSEEVSNSFANSSREISKLILNETTIIYKLNQDRIITEIVPTGKRNLHILCDSEGKAPVQISTDKEIIVELPSSNCSKDFIIRAEDRVISHDRMTNTITIFSNN